MGQFSGHFGGNSNLASKTALVLSGSKENNLRSQSTEGGVMSMTDLK
jgi:hypothetical protein